MFVRSEVLVTDAGRYSCSAAVVNSGGSDRSAIGVRSLSELAAVCRLPPIRAGACEGNDVGGCGEEEPKKGIFPLSH
jgi:hypothetical protein